MISSSIKWAFTFIFHFFRALFLPLWLFMLGVEYVFLLHIFAIASCFGNDISEDDTIILLNSEKEPQRPSIWHKAAHTLGLELIFPPRQRQEEVEDPEVQHIRRVKTQLDGISTPNMSVASPKSRNGTVHESELFSSRDNGSRRTDSGGNGSTAPLRGEDMGDMMRISRSSNEVTRKVERGARFARSGLKPELEVYA